LQFIPSGKEGTKATLKIMGQLVKDGKKNLTVRQTALSLVRGLGPKDWAGEVRNLHAFVRDRIRYVRDIHGVETLATPEKTLEFGQGDCDDKSVLLASLLASAGHPTRFVAIALTDPENFVHVYPETKIGANWIALETTEPVEVGWEPEGVVKRLVWFNN
jgi:hypothetical protein